MTSRRWFSLRAAFPMRDKYVSVEGVGKRFDGRQGEFGQVEQGETIHHG